MNLMVKRHFLGSFFEMLFNSIGYSDFYDKYVIVEPIGLFRIDGSEIKELFDLSQLLYDINRLGDRVATVIDMEAGGFIEQAFTLWEHFIFICDSPVLFPHNRTLDLIAYLKENRDKIGLFDGVVHYHIDQPFLNCYDIEATKWILKEISRYGKTELVSLVISQNGFKNTIEKIEHGLDSFKNHMFSEYYAGNIIVAGNKFYRGKVKELKISIED